MFSVFARQKAPAKLLKHEARKAYADCLNTIRTPAFYTDFSVPDIMEARFDLLILHIALLMHRIQNEPDFDGKIYNQQLFDIMFADMDQSLRESGIGDMGIPKRMRKMMTGFNGRSQIYIQAFQEKDSKTLAATLARNVYAAPDSPDNAKKLADYALQQLKHLSKTPIDTILKGERLFTI
jgi:cytochrome b pre-mRNA-processing protein 3